MNKYRLVLEFCGIGYWSKPGGDDALETLWDMLREGKLFRNWVMEDLLAHRSDRLTGNAIVVILKEKNAYVQPLYGDDAEEYRVELSRNALLKLINDWQALVAQEPDEIIMTRDELGVITLEGVFKEE